MKSKALFLAALCLICCTPAHAIIAVDGTGSNLRYSVSETGIVFRSAGTGYVANCTVTQGGIWAENNLALTNCIGLSMGSDATYGGDINIYTGKTVTGTYNLFGDAAKSFAGTYSDAGATTTWSGDPKFISSTDYRLTGSSPCINAGLNSVWSGTASVTSYNGIGITNAAGAIIAPGGTVDIGAYEYKPPSNNYTRFKLLFE